MVRVCKHTPRERQMALGVFQKHFPQLCELANQPTSNKWNSLFPTGLVTASYKPILASDLPRAADWTWNQSNARQTFNLEEGVTVTLRKVSPRIRNKSSGLAPSFKIWIYEVEQSPSPDIHFIWCEKGIDKHEIWPKTMGVETPIGTVHPEAISLDSLSFLLPFVSVDTAKELGWLYNYN